MVDRLLHGPSPTAVWVQNTLIQPTGQTVPFPNGSLRFLAPRPGASSWTVVITQATMVVVAEQRFSDPAGVYQPFLSLIVEIQKKPPPVVLGGLLADTLPRFGEYAAPP